MATSLFMLIFASQRAPAYLLGNIPSTDIYDTLEDCKEVGIIIFLRFYFLNFMEYQKSFKAREIEGMKIIRFESSIHYANVDRFEYIVKKLAEINIAKCRSKIEGIKKRIEKLKRCRLKMVYDSFL